MHAEADPEGRDVDASPASVLVRAPFGRDTDVLLDLIGTRGLPVRAVSEGEVRHAGEETLALVVTQEALTAPFAAALDRAVAEQPGWSSLPVLALVDARTDGLVRAPAPVATLRDLDARLDVVVLDRPARARSILSALETLVRSRRRQFSIRDQIAQLDEQGSHLEFLFRELDHRVKNVLAKVQSMATVSGRRAPDVTSFLRDFESRLQALARAHDALSGDYEKHATVRDLVDAAVAPFASPERLAVEGPDVALWPQGALTLAMTLHELATNAAKYGALSTGAGRVGVTWQREEEDGGEPRLRLEWRESGGPPVTPPSRTSFGTMLIERIAGAELGGASELVFAPEGVICRILAPIRREPAYGVEWRGSGRPPSEA